MAQNKAGCFSERTVPNSLFWPHGRSCFLSGLWTFPLRALANSLKEGSLSLVVRCSEGPPPVRAVSEQRQGGFYYCAVYPEGPKNCPHTDRRISHNVAEHNEFPCPSQFDLKIMQSVRAPLEFFRRHSFYCCFSSFINFFSFLSAVSHCWLDIRIPGNICVKYQRPPPPPPARPCELESPGSEPGHQHL